MNCDQGVDLSEIRVAHTWPLVPCVRNSRVAHIARHRGRDVRATRSKNEVMR